MTATLTARAELILWGNGCQCAPRTIFDIKPVGKEWWITFDVGGVQIFDRTAPDNEVRGVLSLDAARAARTLAALLADRPARCAFKDREFYSTGIGNINMTLPLSTGAVEVLVTSDEPDRLIAVGDVLIELVREAGLPVADELHPVSRYKQVRRRILRHAAVADEAPADEPPGGFLEMLRPYRGLREEVFADLLAAVRGLSDQLRTEHDLDRELVSALWRIGHFGGAWGPRNKLIPPEAAAQLEAWIEGLSLAIALLLEGHEEQVAFEALPER